MKSLTVIAAAVLLAACGAPAATAPSATTSAPASSSIPLTRAPSGHYVSPVSINGQGPFSFVVDTGAEACAVYASFARAHALPGAGAEELQGQTGAASVALVRVSRLQLANHETAGLSCAVLPDRPDGAPLDGIIGLDVFGAYVVGFDTKDGALTLTGDDPATALGASAFALDATRLQSGLLAFQVKLNGAQGIAVLDTGARRSIINLKFARAAGINTETLGERAALHGATANRTDLNLGDLGDLQLGQYLVRDMNGGAADLPVFEAFGVADQPAMILGLDVIERFALTVDFPRQRVWFRPIEN